jgi:cell division septum initiation protein DivIVA/tetratricopeptide (TPR) repeat protein
MDRRFLQAFKLHRLIAGCLSATLFLAATCRSDASAAQQENESIRGRIAKLESELFNRTLDEAELIKMLDQLAEPKSRKDHAWVIAKRAAGCQKSIIKYANQCPDIDVREICADIVSYLDDGWRKTGRGKQYISLCRAFVNSEAEFKKAWQLFLADSTDQAAFEKVLSPPPATAWRWIENIQNANEARNGLSKRRRSVKAGHANYLLLRVRELSPDSFAAKKLGELDLRTLPKHSFPAHGVLSNGDSYRQVGHVLLKRVEWNTPSFDYHNRSDLYSFYPKQFQVFRVDSGKRQIGKGRLVQTVYFDNTTYGPYYRDKQNQRKPLTSNELASPMFNRIEEAAQIVIPLRMAPSAVPIINVSAGDREHFQYHPMRPPTSGPVPWWWKHFVSKSNAKKMAFLRRKADEKVPGVFSEKEIVGIAPTGRANDAPVPEANAPSFVFLPPRLEIRSKTHEIAAELAIDRCAEEMQLLSMQIVDRQNLKQIFDERQRNSSTEPMTSFDAMVCLKISNDQLKPDATLSVIDLSTGSKLQEATFAWPIQEDQIESIRALLKRSITSIKRPNKKRIKVRYLGAREPPQLRLRPIATQLTRSIDGHFRKNKLIQIVDHIESASAAEESIFLMMGLTRNSSGSGFSPAADVTVSMSIDQRDASGKTFENVMLEVRTTFETTGQAPQFAIHSDQIGKFKSTLIPKIWGDVLAGVKTSATGKQRSNIQSLAIRRAQADRELQLIQMIDRKLPRSEQTIQRYNLAHSALKLDPTYDKAAFAVASANASIYRTDPDRPDRDKLALEGMRIVSDLATADPTDQESIKSYGLAASGMLALLNESEKAKSRIEKIKEIKKEHPNRKISIQPRHENDAKLSELVDSNLKRKICLAVVEHIEIDLNSRLDERTHSHFLGSMIESAFRGLKATGSSSNELKPQIKRMVDTLERIQAESDSFLARATDLDARMLRQKTAAAHQHIGELRRCVMSVVCECQLTDEYDRLLPLIKSDLMRGKPNSWLIERQRRAIQPLGDAKRLASFESWIKAQRMEYGKRNTARKKKTPDLQLAAIRFPIVDVFAGSEPETVRTDSFEIKLPETHLVIPLAHSRNGIYFLANDASNLGWQSLSHAIDSNAFSSRMKLGFVPVSKDGRAAGTAEFFDLPQEVQGQVMIGCVANDRFLVLGTQANFRHKNIAGLYSLNIEKKKWKYFGVADGLPCQWITSIQSLSGDRALCTGSSRPEIRPGEKRYTRPRDSIFSFDLRTQKIRQHGLESAYENGRLPGKLLCVYENRGLVFGHSKYALWRDLLSARPKQFPLKPDPASNLEEVQYSNARASARIRDSVFFVNSRGLHQMGIDGQHRRSWNATSSYSMISPLTRTNFNPVANAPRQSPLPWFPNLIATDEMLLMVDGHGQQIVGYDPKKELWYGPVAVPKIIYGIPGETHVWVGGKALRRIAIADIAEAAKKCGRVMTANNFLDRQQKLVSTMTGLDRAKIEFSLLQFEQSKRFLREILKQTPDDAEAHLMMGILHDTWGLDDLQQASLSYRRAEELSQNNRSLGLSAAKLHLETMIRHRKFDQAAELAKQLLE